MLIIYGSLMYTRTSNIPRLFPCRFYYRISNLYVATLYVYIAKIILH